MIRPPLIIRGLLICVRPGVILIPSEDAVPRNISVPEESFVAGNISQVG
jgi:hypothetical protein